jgi:hypothetical protein
LVFVPAYEPHWERYQMCYSQDCIWAGDENMRTVCPLEAIYKAKFDLAPADLESLKQYFQVILKVPDYSWKHYVGEIRALKNSDSMDFDWINKLYILIDEARKWILDVHANEIR